MSDGEGVVVSGYEDLCSDLCSLVGVIGRM